MGPRGLLATCSPARPRASRHISPDRNDPRDPPEPGCAATVAAGRARGLAIECCPLFVVEAVDWSPPPPEQVDALLLGSANALRHGGPGLAAFRGKPAYVVGPATAEAAKAAGFVVAAKGEGGLQAVVDGLVPPHRLLRVAGADHVPLSVPPGVSIETCVAYASVSQPLPPTVADRLSDGSLVLLHSAIAAEHFAAECDRLGIGRGKIRLAALGARIAAAAGEGWGEVRVAEEPADRALLALAEQMCHEPPLR